MAEEKTLLLTQEAYDKMKDPNKQVEVARQLDGIMP